MCVKNDLIFSPSTELNSSLSLCVHPGGISYTISARWPLTIQYEKYYVQKRETESACASEFNFTLEFFCFIGSFIVGIAIGLLFVLVAIAIIILLIVCKCFHAKWKTKVITRRQLHSNSASSTGKDIPLASDKY